MATDFGKVFYVNYLDSVSESKVKAVMAILLEIVQKEKPDTIYFVISSSGGNVEPGITLFNFLRALPVRLVMHNTGSIDSIANVIFLASDIRYTSTNSTFLFHGITWTFGNTGPFTRSVIAETLSNISAAESKIKKIIVERTAVTSAEVDELFSQGEVKNPDYAKSKGIVHEIREPKIPADAQGFTFNLN